MQADMSMLVGESVSQGSLGVGISILLAWLRSKNWFKNTWTLPISYMAALVSTMGVHFIFEGDFITGSTLIIKIPDAHHVLESLVMFTSNIGGQKAFALGNKMTEAVNILSKLQQGPTLTSSVTAGGVEKVKLSESHSVGTAESKPGD